MNLDSRPENSFPNAAERAKILAHHIVKVPEWASFSSLSRSGVKLKYPELRACAVLAGHGRSLTPLDPSTTSGFADTYSFKGMHFSAPLFQYDNSFGRNEVLVWGLLRKSELDSHKKIPPVFATHGLPVEELVDIYSIDNFQIIDRVTRKSVIMSEREFIARLKLEFICIQKKETPDDGFRIISDPNVFFGKDTAIRAFLAELEEEEHPFVVADRRMPHNLRLSNITSHFKAQFPKKERQDFFVQVIREALQDFPWFRYPLFSSLKEVQAIPEQFKKTDADFLQWYAQEFIPAVLGTYVGRLHTFATHGWVTPQNVTIVGIPTDLDSVHGPEITDDQIDESRMQKDRSDARSSVRGLCEAFGIHDASPARQHFDRSYTAQLERS